MQNQTPPPKYLVVASNPRESRDGKQTWIGHLYFANNPATAIEVARFDPGFGSFSLTVKTNKVPDYTVAHRADPNGREWYAIAA